MIQKKRKFRVIKNCQFCNEKIEPSFRNVGVLAKYISDRGRILGRDKTGICAKHQRKLTQEIKRARQIALLPFVSGI